MNYINIICGPICSGKTTYCKSLAVKTSAKYISLSSIVKSLAKTQLRSELQTTDHLSADITAELFLMLGDEINEDWLIDGIRQWSIVENLLAYYGHSVIKLVWLEVPEITRKDRYIAASRLGDDMPFEEASKRDYDLGLGQIESVIKNLCTIIPS